MLEKLFELEARVGPPQSLGSGPMGERRLVPILGGHFHGRLNGKVLPGGADWQILRSDGFADIDARYQLETADGHRIEVRSRGLRHGPPDVIARLAAGYPFPATPITSGRRCASRPRRPSSTGWCGRWRSRRASGGRTPSISSSTPSSDGPRRTRGIALPGAAILPAAWRSRRSTPPIRMRVPGATRPRWRIP